MQEAFDFAHLDELANEVAERGDRVLVTFEAFKSDVQRLAKRICLIDYIKVLIELSTALPDESNVFAKHQFGYDTEYIPRSNYSGRVSALMGEYIKYDSGKLDPVVLVNALHRILDKMYSCMEEYANFMSEQMALTVVEQSATKFSDNSKGFIGSLNSILTTYLKRASEINGWYAESVEASLASRVHVTEPAIQTPQSPREMVTADVLVTEPGGVVAMTVETERAQGAIGETASVTFNIDEETINTSASPKIPTWAIPPQVVSGEVQGVTTAVNIQTPPVESMPNETVVIPEPSIASAQRAAEQPQVTQSVITALVERPRTQRSSVTTPSKWKWPLYPPSDLANDYVKAYYYNLLANMAHSFDIELRMVKHENVSTLLKDFYTGIERMPTMIKTLNVIRIEANGNGKLDVTITRDNVSPEQLTFKRYAEYMERNYAAWLTEKTIFEHGTRHIFSVETKFIGEFLGTIWGIIEPEGLTLTMMFSIAGMDLRARPRIDYILPRAKVIGYEAHILDECVPIMYTDANYSNRIGYMIQRNRLQRHVRLMEEFRFSRNTASYIYITNYSSQYPETRESFAKILSFYKNLARVDVTQFPMNSKPLNSVKVSAAGILAGTISYKEICDMVLNQETSLPHRLVISNLSIGEKEKAASKEILSINLLYNSLYLLNGMRITLMSETVFLELKGFVNQMSQFRGLTHVGETIEMNFSDQSLESLEVKLLEPRSNDTDISRAMKKMFFFLAARIGAVEHKTHLQVVTTKESTYDNRRVNVHVFSVSLRGFFGVLSDILNYKFDVKNAIKIYNWEFQGRYKNQRHIEQIRYVIDNFTVVDYDLEFMRSAYLVASRVPSVTSTVIHTIKCCISDQMLSDHMQTMVRKMASQELTNKLYNTNYPSILNKPEIKENFYNLRVYYKTFPGLGSEKFWSKTLGGMKDIKIGIGALTTQGVTHVITEARSKLSTIRGK